MNPCCAGMFCGRCKIRTYGTFTGPGVFKTPGINQLSQPSKKKNAVPSSTGSMSMPISTLSSMLLMVLYEFLQTQKLASFTERRLHFSLRLHPDSNWGLNITSVVFYQLNYKAIKPRFYFILQNITP